MDITLFEILSKHEYENKSNRRLSLSGAFSSSKVELLEEIFPFIERQRWQDVLIFFRVTTYVVLGISS